MSSVYQWQQCICPNCAMAFCITVELSAVKEQLAEQDHKNKYFYCPNGHQVAFTAKNKKPEAEKAASLMPDTREYLEQMTKDQP